MNNQQLELELWSTTDATVAKKKFFDSLHEQIKNFLQSLSDEGDANIPLLWKWTGGEVCPSILKTGYRQSKQKALYCNTSAVKSKSIANR